MTRVALLLSLTTWVACFDPIALNEDRYLACAEAISISKEEISSCVVLTSCLPSPLLGSVGTCFRYNLEGQVATQNPQCETFETCEDVLACAGLRRATDADCAGRPELSCQDDVGLLCLETDKRVVDCSVLGGTCKTVSGPFVPLIPCEVRTPATCEDSESFCIDGAYGFCLEETFFGVECARWGLRCRSFGCDTVERSLWRNLSAGLECRARPCEERCLDEFRAQTCVPIGRDEGDMALEFDCRDYGFSRCDIELGVASCR